MNNKGLFVTFESTREGLGKTTQSQLLYDRLISNNYDVILTREPGGTELGRVVRDIILNNKDIKLSKSAELLLFMADRAQHYNEIIKPALDEGKIVLCDRYVDSTTVYQGFVGGWSKDILDDLHDISTNSLMPDVTFMFDGDSFKTLDKNDRIESRGDKYHNEVYQGYKKIIQESNDGRFVLVDANGDINKINDKIYNYILEHHKYNK